VPEIKHLNLIGIMSIVNDYLILFSMSYIILEVKPFMIKLFRHYKILTVSVSGLLLISQPVLSEEIDIFNVMETLHLTTEQSTADLFLTVDKAGYVKEMTVKFHPSPTPSANESQVKLSCGESSNIVDNLFSKPGKYKVYYVTENDTIIPTSQHSVVYKNKIGNQPPVAFNLFTPWNDAETKTTDLRLKWENTTDPDGDVITYTLVIAKDSDFNDVVLQQEEISHSQFIIGYDTVLEGGAKGLKENTTYYWRVTAIDNFGVQTASRQVFSFQTKDSRGGFDLDDYNSYGLLSEPTLPSPLFVNVSGKHYSVTLIETSNQLFTLEDSPQPTDKVDEYEATYDPQTGKISIPGYGAMEMIEGSSQWRLID